MQSLADGLSPGSPVAKEKKEGKQITFRVPETLYTRLERAAAGIGLDMSSALRLLLKRHLTELEAEADEIRAKEEGSQDESAPS